MVQHLTKADFVDGNKVVIQFGGKDYEGIVKLGDDTKDIQQDNSLVTAHMDIAASVSAEFSKDSEVCVVSTNSSSIAITSSALEAPPKATSTSTSAVEVSPILHLRKVIPKIIRVQGEATGF